MKIVSNKKQMYELLRKGAFGNTARTWSSYVELLASGYSGLLGIRAMEPGGQFLAHVPLSQVADGPYIYSEMQSDEHIVLQGEVYRSTTGLYLYCSVVKKHMRVALREAGRHYWLTAAYAQLQAAMWPSDYDWLMELLTEYPDSVVEFSSYNRAVGLLPKRNTIIWEVRNY